jgi:two-component system sensor histidine kinase KdpD
VSHELRTPLTIIAGAARILERHPRLVEDQALRRVVADLAGSARRMERVIGNMLLLARADEDITTEPILVRVAISEAVTTLHKDYPKAEVHIVPGQPAAATADGLPSWTQLILLNLLLNAHLHGDKDEPILVQWEEAGELVNIHICNRGDALDDDARERWFQPFVRSRPRSREFAGAGLGLTVCRSLARSQGGDLYARSWTTDQGTRMTLALPASND